MTSTSLLVMETGPQLLCLLAAVLCGVLAWRGDLKPGLYRDIGRVACLGGLAVSVEVFMALRNHGIASKSVEYAYGITLDRFSETVTVMVLVLCFLVLTISAARIEAFRPNMGFFYLFVMTATLAASAIALSAEMVASWLVLQLLVVSVAAVTGLMKTDIASLRSALRQLLAGSFASLLVGLGFAFIYSATGITSAPPMRAVGTSHLLFLVGTVLVALGACVLMGQVVLAWLFARMSEEAPSPVEMIIQGFPAIAGAALLVRFVLPFTQLQGLPTAIALVGSLTVLVSAFFAWSRRDFRAQLAWFFLMQSGFVLLSILALGAAGLQLLLLQLGSTLICLVVVGAAVSLLVDGDISGLWHHHRGIAFCLLVGGFALAGLPPSIGFFGHWLLLSELIGLGYGWVVVVLATASVFAALVPLGWIIEMGSFRDGEVHAIDVVQPRWVMALGAVLLVVGGAGLGPLMGALFNVALGVHPA